MSGPLVRHERPNYDSAFWGGMASGCMTSGLFNRIRPGVLQGPVLTVAKIALGFLPGYYVQIKYQQTIQPYLHKVVDDGSSRVYYYRSWVWDRTLKLLHLR